MKRRFYQDQDDGRIEFDPPVDQPLLLEDFLDQEQMARLHWIDDEPLVQRYCRLARELQETKRAIWDNSTPPEED